MSGPIRAETADTSRLPSPDSLTRWQGVGNRDIGGHGAGNDGEVSGGERGQHRRVIRRQAHDVLIAGGPG